MVFLGVILSLNSSACLMINGRFTIVAQEERFTNIKSFQGYPKKTIDHIQWSLLEIN